MNLTPSKRRPSDANRAGTDKSPTDPRRTMLLVISIGLLVACAVVTWKFGSEGSARFLSAATGRVGLLMGALWLAWPSLKKPARWLPPGIAMAGVIGLAVMAVRPQLILVVVPAIGTIAALTVFIRGLK
ncbi:hypothetical protein K227x_13660 [Rubripirellula lacrimiformis]|uniref:Transmembrane protein n=1 Tax=Rubripirellula lacrimiformis TaxID=1930273 RepID=A0A517N759_9BACT|nr:hypothetical protein [Rubripirellula lacrimiformis]QDT02987.1 hypothetical protein K227x_13660 [Rubripirellula lacrimiformis]